ncbi:hypothetical protein GCM10010505_52540 [Kitasatospora aburaviensis]
MGEPAASSARPAPPPAARWASDDMGPLSGPVAGRRVRRDGGARARWGISDKPTPTPHPDFTRA